MTARYNQDQGSNAAAGPQADWTDIWSSDVAAQRLRGSLHRCWIEGTRLRGNPLGDPIERPCLVYRPKCEADVDRLPHLYLLHGSQVSCASWLHSGALEILDDWMSDSDSPYLIVMPDAWTSVGGSQYLDSPAVGNYLSYLRDDVIPFIDEKFPTPAAPRTRLVLGHSSGGLGAYNLLSDRPSRFTAAALIAADALFEGVHHGTAMRAARQMSENFDGRWDLFGFHARRRRPGAAPAEFEELADQWMLAHAYSRRSSPEFLFDCDGQVREAVWQRWLTFDPVRRASRDAATLSSLARLYITGGQRDPTFSDLSSRALTRALRKSSVTVHHEIRPLGHPVGEYLPRALEVLTAAADSVRHLSGSHTG